MYIPFMPLVTCPEDAAPWARAQRNSDLSKMAEYLKIIDEILESADRPRPLELRAQAARGMLRHGIEGLPKETAR